MVFKQMLALLSGHLNSNTDVPACFGSDFESDKYITVLNLLPGLALCSSSTELNNDFWLNSIVQFSHFGLQVITS
jgi:hypothetical protein